MSTDYLTGHGSDFDQRTTGRWSREEHEKFIEGINLKRYISFSKYWNISCLYIMLNLFTIAMSIYGRDWKKVEQYIGTRSGAQIRSHA